MTTPFPFFPAMGEVTFLSPSPLLGGSARSAGVGVSAPATLPARRRVA
jgi:hypothetical protein